jgi:hypothetical protein
MLPDWIDLIFGKKQQGKAAIEANNVYFYLTYYGSVDVASIEDEGLRQATELQIAHFGQSPMQLFYRRHAQKQSRENRRRHQTLSDLYDMKKAPFCMHRSLDQISTRDADKEEEAMPKKDLPFTDAPLSYWASFNIIDSTIACLCMLGYLDSHVILFGVCHILGTSWSSPTRAPRTSCFHQASIDGSMPGCRLKGGLSFLQVGLET